MCLAHTTQEQFDQVRSDAFGQKLLDMLNAGALSLMLSIGHRTGLFDAMAGGEWLTSKDLAEKAERSERYVREWLGAMATGGIVEHDPDAKTYRLPPEHAAMLTRAATPNVAASMQWFSVLGGVEDHVVAAFSHGRGVPYSAYKRFHQVMAEESAQTTVAGLEPHILGIVPGLVRKLEAGLDVVDVGCGAGGAILAMAERFPNSRFLGIDFSTDGIGIARNEAERRGITNARFEVVDAAKWDARGAFDLVFTFDAVHDQARPDVVLANIRRALRPGGVYVMQDIGASSFVHENIEHPMGPFLYTISCMHCMSVSLANDGMGLGAVWGRQKAMEMLREAGFGDVTLERLPHDQMNEYFVARP